jgi:hypothetical protein
MKGYTPAGRWVTEVEVEGEPVEVWRRFKIKGASSRASYHKTTDASASRSGGVWAYALAGSPIRMRDHQEAYAPVGAVIAERTTSEPPAIRSRCPN